MASVLARDLGGFAGCCAQPLCVVSLRGRAVVSVLARDLGGSASCCVEVPSRGCFAGVYRGVDCWRVDRRADLRALCVKKGEGEEEQTKRRRPRKMR